MSTATVLTVVAAVLGGLTAGVFLAFSTFVVHGLDRNPAFSTFVVQGLDRNPRHTRCQAPCVPLVT